MVQIHGNIRIRCTFKTTNILQIDAKKPTERVVQHKPCIVQEEEDDDEDLNPIN